MFGVEQATLIDNWDVLGLRATGSIDYTTDSLLVPEAYTYHATTETPLRGGILYTMGIINLGMICHSAWALGVGRRMLDELRKLLEAGSGPRGEPRREPCFPRRLRDGRGEAAGRARPGLRDLARDPGDAATAAMRSRCEQNTLTPPGAPARDLDGRGGVDVRLPAAGTTALRAGTIQRFFRDMHAGTQHMTSSPPGPPGLRPPCSPALAPGKAWQFLHARRRRAERPPDARTTAARAAGLSAPRATGPRRRRPAAPPPPPSPAP